MAEIPAVMLMLFFGFAFPLIGICVLGYRTAILYCCVRDVAYKAATSQTFTAAAANGNAAWAADLAAAPGITSGGPPVYTIVSTNIAKGTIRIFHQPLKTIYSQTDIYSMNTTCIGAIQPFLGTSWSFFGQKIPGLNDVYKLQMTQQVYVENPNGLTQ
jgi:hypothetical protein